MRKDIKYHHAYVLNLSSLSQRDLLFTRKKPRLLRIYKNRIWSDPKDVNATVAYQLDLKLL